MKNLVTNTDIKLLVENVPLQNIQKFSLNNIAKLLYEIARFTRSLKKTAINIVADSSNANFALSNKINNNLSTDPVV